MKDFEIKERFLEDCIFDIIESDNGFNKLSERGLLLPAYKYWARQLEIPGYGISDIIGISKRYNTIRVCIIELKKDEFKLNYLSQLMRYADGVEKYLQWLKKTKYQKITWQVETVLICKNYLLSNDDVYLSRYTDTAFYEFSFDPLSGLSFNEFMPENYGKIANYNNYSLDINTSDIYEPSGFIDLHNDDEDIPF